MSIQDHVFGDTQIPPLQMKIAAMDRKGRGGDVTPQEVAKQLLRFATEACLSVGISPHDHYEASAASINITKERGMFLPPDLIVGILQYLTILFAQGAGISSTKAMMDTLETFDMASQSGQQNELWLKLHEEIRKFQAAQPAVDLTPDT